MGCRRIGIAARRRYMFTPSTGREQNSNGSQNARKKLRFLRLNHAVDIFIIETEQLLLKRSVLFAFSCTSTKNRVDKEYSLKSTDIQYSRPGLPGFIM